MGFIPNLSDDCYNGLIRLLDAVHEKAIRERKQILLFIDEMMVQFFLDWPGLTQFKKDFNKYKQVHVYMAINPAGEGLDCPLNFELHVANKNENLLAVQLQTRYRNSYEIATFLLHLTYLYNESKGTYKCLSPSYDKPLDKNKLTCGYITRWFYCTYDMTDIRILTYFQELDFMPKEENVLISPIDGREDNKSLQEWCIKNGAEFVTQDNMMGSERDNVFAFIGDKSGNIEIFSRARKVLFIISRYSNIGSMYIFDIFINLKSTDINLSREGLSEGDAPLLNDLLKHESELKCSCCKKHCRDMVQKSILIPTKFDYVHVSSQDSDEKPIGDREDHGDHGSASGQSEPSSSSGSGTGKRPSRGPPEGQGSDESSSKRSEFQARGGFY